jgi:hypothetical protein
MTNWSVEFEAEIADISLRLIFRPGCDSLQVTGRTGRGRYRKDNGEGPTFLFLGIIMQLLSCAQPDIRPRNS